MYHLLDITKLMLDRLRQQWLLVFWTLLGLTAASALGISVVLYVDGVNTAILDERLDDPPFAYRLRYLGAWNGNIGREDFTTADDVVRTSFENTIGLPSVRITNYVRQAPSPVQLLRDEAPPLALGTLPLASIDGLNGLAEITSGTWDFDAPPGPDDTGMIPVLLPETMLYAMGIQVGDHLQISDSSGDTVTLRVAALWRAISKDDPNWIFPPSFFDEVLLISQESLWTLFEEQGNAIDEAAWFTIFDGSAVRAADIPDILARTASAQRVVEGVLPGIRLDESPQDRMQAFVQDVEQLTQQLVIVMLPVGGVVLYFVTLVAGLLVSRQQNEDIVLRSRGMSRIDNLALHTLMWTLLAGVAFGGGVILGPLAAELVGRTRSFLDFGGLPNTFDIELTRDALTAGLATSCLAASAGLLLAFRNTTTNIARFKQSSGRAKHPWWQRAYLDLLLLAPGAYVLYTLTRQGGVAVEAESPFTDPLTFIGPTLFSLGATLLFIRLLPLLMRACGGLLHFTVNIPLLMALREITRSRVRYQGTLLMMCFTLALTGFTASMADTINRSLRDTINYQTGADAVAVLPAEAQIQEGEQDAETGEATVEVTGFNVLPIDNLYEIPGIVAVSRAGRYAGRLRLSGTTLDGHILGVDRAQLATVTRYREDFSQESLAILANKLAVPRNAVIIDRQTLDTFGLLLNQEITVEIEALGTWYPLRVQIVAVVEYFPTLDPNEGFFLISNIEPIFEAVGTALPHDIWLRLEDNADTASVRAAISDAGFPIVDWIEPDLRLEEARADAARRGVLGFLSIGFIATTLLTLVATLVQSSAAFRAQSQQLGALRAMGLSGISVGIYLIGLQGLNTISGVFGGTTIGVATTLLFLPLLDFSGGLPPYLVRVAWQQLILVYTVFAGVLLFIALITTLITSREQVSKVSRLGDV